MEITAAMSFGSQKRREYVMRIMKSKIEPMLIVPDKALRDVLLCYLLLQRILVTFFAVGVHYCFMCIRV